MSTDISALANRAVIIGGGAAGLMTALQLAPEPVLILSKAPLGAEASSLWAQGGLAAAMGGDDDPALHLADTLAAGAALCDEAVARRIVHPAGSAGYFSTAPIPTDASVRDWRWRRVPAPNFPTWSSSSFIRPRSTGRRARCRC